MYSIPSIEQLRQRASMRALEAQYGRTALVDALRAEAAAVRARPSGIDPPEDATPIIEAAVAVRLAHEARPSLRRVINATGVVIHTNLGRAPLGARAIDRIAALGRGYTNLEYDLEAGRRGRRDVHAARLICRLTGAAAAVVVNNNAAGTLIALAALASGREAIISRGELVEIGGGFRIPDVMTQSGAILREVGTTNRTRAADYAAAIGERTAMILRVHPSNFRIEGFTERPRLDELVAIGRRFNIPVVEDLGSGYLGPEHVSGAREFGSSGARLAHRSAAEFRREGGFGEEPVVSQSLAEGAELVLFSGDKLLGGPQAGIIAGTEAAVAKVRSHPLMRALRVDKLTYAALEATLEDYATGRAAESVPVIRMIAASVEDIDRRASALAGRFSARGLTAEVIEGESTIGGGSAPGSTLPTRLVRLTHPTLTASALETRLRQHDPPVIARIQDDRVVLDLRTVEPEDDESLALSLTT